MNIVFHYFAVKTLAYFAGYSEKDAQYLAELSQFVDDFDIYELKFLVRDMRNHDPVTTGFNDTMDIIRLAAWPKSQKNVVVPFHFIPPKPLSELEDGKRYRTVPATRNDESLMGKMLRYAMMKYRLQQGDSVNLMRIGMYLHIFADTYAHQSFSGFHAWENRTASRGAYFIGGDGANLYENYRPPVESPLGHGEMGTVPDETYLSFNMYQAISKGSQFLSYYRRNNRDEFTIAAKEITKYLYECRQNMLLFDERKWEQWVPRLHKGFQFQFKDSQKDYNMICSHWKSIFPEINFSYNKYSIMGDLGRYSENSYADPQLFDQYCALAKEVRGFVHGTLTVPVIKPNPRIDSPIDTKQLYYDPNRPTSNDSMA